jgi:hypothetical protein
MNDRWSMLLILVLLGVALIWIWSRWKGKGRGSNRLQSAINLIADVNENLKLIEQRRITPQSTKKFKTGVWKVNQDRLDFLDPETITSLTEAFKLIGESNNEIEVAKKGGSIEVLQNLPLDKIKTPLTKGKEGLVKWLRANLQSEMMSRRGLFGF